MSLFNPWVLLGATLTILFAFGLGYYKGSQHATTAETAKSNQEKVDTINENIEIRKKQDQVLRPDYAAYVDSLRERTF